MGNRKQPFGYKMSLGEIVIQKSEAKLVQEIFLRYIAGESLNELTESLRQQDTPASMRSRSGWSAVSAGPCIVAAHGHETVKNESCGAV